MPTAATAQQSSAAARSTRTPHSRPSSASRPQGRADRGRPRRLERERVGGPGDEQQAGGAGEGRLEPGAAGAREERRAEQCDDKGGDNAAKGRVLARRAVRKDAVRVDAGALQLVQADGAARQPRAPARQRGRGEEGGHGHGWAARDGWAGEHG
jgi:hypothetical protein